VRNAFRALAAVAVFHSNHGQPGPLRLKSTLEGKIEVQYLANEEQFPPGVQPAFALKQDYLVFGSSPDAIARFHAAPSGLPSLAPEEVNLLKLSLSGCWRYLTERRKAVVEFAATKNQISAEEASKRLDHLLVVLQLFDRIEMKLLSSVNLARFTLRVQTAKPLR
jgi:hypothetical protein